MFGDVHLNYNNMLSTVVHYGHSLVWRGNASSAVRKLFKVGGISMQSFAKTSKKQQAR